MYCITAHKSGDCAVFATQQNDKVGQEKYVNWKGKLEEDFRKSVHSIVEADLNPQVQIHPGNENFEEWV